MVVDGTASVTFGANPMVNRQRPVRVAEAIEEDVPSFMRPLNRGRRAAGAADSPKQPHRSKSKNRSEFETENENFPQQSRKFVRPNAVAPNDGQWAENPDPYGNDQGGQFVQNFAKPNGFAFKPADGNMVAAGGQQFAPNGMPAPFNPNPQFGQNGAQFAAQPPQFGQQPQFRPNPQNRPAFGAGDVEETKMNQTVKHWQRIAQNRENEEPPMGKQPFGSVQSTPPNGANAGNRRNQPNAAFGQNLPNGAMPGFPPPNPNEFNGNPNVQSGGFGQIGMPNGVPPQMAANRMAGSQNGTPGSQSSAAAQFRGNPNAQMNAPGLQNGQFGQPNSQNPQFGQPNGQFGQLGQITGQPGPITNRGSQFGQQNGQFGPPAQMNGQPGPLTSRGGQPIPQNGHLKAQNGPFSPTAAMSRSMENLNGRRPPQPPHSPNQPPRRSPIPPQLGQSPAESGSATSTGSIPPNRAKSMNMLNNAIIDEEPSEPKTARQRSTLMKGTKASAAKGAKSPSNANGVAKGRVRTMPKYQVKYLNLRGKGEPIRLLLNFVQEPFEDHRENFLEYAKYKDKFPLPRLPRLIVDGKLELCFTHCILSYLGRKYGLIGETDEEKALCDVLGARLTEYMNQIKPWVYCLMGITPVERLDDLNESVFLPCVQRDYGPVFEKQLASNNTGYLVGDQLTWVDFYAACFTDQCLAFGPPGCLDKFQRLGYHRNAVFALPQIQEHLKNRPETVF